MSANVFVSSDFGALELVTFAQTQLDMLGRSALADLLRKGLDPHRAFACEHILKIPYEAFDKSIKAHAQARQLAKCWNFGKPGAMGEARFIEWAWTTYDVLVTPDENKRIDAVWHAAFPEVRMFWHLIKTKMQTGVDEKGRPIYTVPQPRSNRIRGGCGFPDAANTHFQGLGADVAKHAAWLLLNAGLAPSSPMFGCYQVLFEHDAYVTVAPRERAPAVLAEQERIMIAASAYYCPDVPMKVESTITDRYTK